MDSRKADAQMIGDVLKEHPLGIDLANDARHVWPEVPGIFVAAPLTGAGKRLARVARTEEIHCATPWPAAKGSKVRPNRRFVQGAVLKTRRQDRAGSRFDFHIADRSSRRLSDAQSQVDPTISGAERKHAKGT